LFFKYSCSSKPVSFDFLLKEIGKLLEAFVGAEYGFFALEYGYPNPNYHVILRSEFEREM